MPATAVLVTPEEMFTTPAVGQRARRRPHHQERSAGVDGHQTVEILHRGLRH